MRPYYFVVALPLVTSGCATTLPPDVIASHQSEAASGVPPATYTSPLAGYVHRVPVDPKPWRQQNDAQSPEGDAS